MKFYICVYVYLSIVYVYLSIIYIYIYILNKLIKMRLTENLPLFCCTRTRVDNCYIILPKRKERLWDGAEGWTPSALPCAMQKLELEV